jgi:molecular chaperone GrpE
MLNKIKKFMSNEIQDPQVENEDNIIDHENDEVDIQESTTIDELTSIQAALDEAKDKYLRLFAEFDNYKKRSIKENYDIRRTAAQETIVALLPILDDFDRAKKSAEAGNEVFSDGVTLVYTKLYHTLEHKGLKQMDSTGVDFDPEYHEAITDIPAPSDDLKGKVIDTIEKGYILNEKIIRHAKVVVGK